MKTLWPPAFQNVEISGMRAIEGLAQDMFGIAADDPSPPACVVRWAGLSLLRLYSDGIGDLSAKLDADIALAAAEFASIGRTRQ